MEDVAGNLKSIVNLFVEFRALRDVSQDLGRLETKIAKALEKALVATKFDPDRVSRYMENFQQEIEGLKTDLETLVEEINSIVDDLILDTMV